MADTYKQLTDLIVNDGLVKGAPRFNPESVRDVRLKGGNAIFYLASDTLTIPVDGLTLDEARIAYGHCSKEEDKQCEDKGAVDAFTYGMFPPTYVYKYRFYAAIILIAIVLIIFGPFIILGELNQMSINNDMGEAQSIAMDDASVQQFAAGKDVSFQTISYNYYDPVSGNTLKSRGQYMAMTLQAWVFVNGQWPGENFTYRKPVEVDNFYMKVDLKNKKVINVDENRVQQFPDFS